MLEQAIRDAFGDAGDEALQRRIVELGYLDADAPRTRRSPTSCTSARAAYFRRLRQAVDRVADWLLAREGAG